MPVETLSPAPRALRPSRRGDARCRAFIAAASDLFLERGFAGVRMSEVVHRAGGSLATLYDTFGDKQGLFEAILACITSEIVAPLLDADIDRKPPEEALQLLGESLLSQILQPSALAWHRMVMTEGPKHPELRAALFRRGPGGVRQRLGSYLSRQARAGRLRIPNANLAAAQFLGLVRAGVHLEAVCGERVRRDSASIRRHVGSAVTVFLEGCGMADRSSPRSGAVSRERKARGIERR